MNPLLTTKAETFRSGTDNLEFYHNRLIKLTNGVLLFCSGGEAEITIDLEKHHIIPNTNIMLLPGSILSLRSASPDFQIHYFAYSGEMMKVACFRLDPAFMHFMKENSCYTHTRLETIRPILRMIEASTAIYADKENQFRESIAQNLLQIFFLDTYDKVQRYFTKEQLEGGNRKGQLFKKFIHLVHTNCTMQRDVAFYAEQLCGCLLPTGPGIHAFHEREFLLYTYQTRNHTPHPENDRGKHRHLCRQGKPVSRKHCPEPTSDILPGYL